MVSCRLRFTTTAYSMPQPHRRRRGPKPDRRRALELLAASPDGCTEALMFANGFTAELLVELVRAGVATAKAERNSRAPCGVRESDLYARPDHA